MRFGAPALEVPPQRGTEKGNCAEAEQGSLDDWVMAGGLVYDEG